MTSDTEFDVSFLAIPGQANLPSLRFMYRSIVESKTYERVLVDTTETLFHAVGPALLWDKAMLLRLCTQLSKAAKGRHPADADDAVALCKLLFSHRDEVGELYKNLVLNKWHRHPEVIKRAFSDSLAALESEPVRQLVQHPSLAPMSALYDLDPLETEILEYALAITEWPVFRRFLYDMRLPSKVSAWELAAAMMSCTVPDLRKTLDDSGKLRACGLISLNLTPADMDGFIRVGPVSQRLSMFKADSRDAVQSELLVPVASPSLSLSDFPHLEKEFKWIVQCLQTAVRSREVGVNILIQGPPGMGKTEFAGLLVQATGLCGFQAGDINPYADWATEIVNALDNYHSMQCMLKTHPGGAVMVFNETGLAANHAERLLRRRLMTCTIPTIWICQKPSSMDDGLLRRYLFHVELDETPIGPRRSLVQQVTSGFTIEAETLETIAADTSITPAQLNMAARFARLLTEEDSEARGEAFVTAIDAGQRANARETAAFRRQPD